MQSNRSVSLMEDCKPTLTAAWNCRAALAAAPAQPVYDGWKPIETAPKDGTPLLLRSKKGRIADGTWITATSSCGGWAWAYVNQEPVEWRPLPDGDASAQPVAEPGTAYAELPESLTLAVNRWFAENTGSGGCSDKDVRELAELFYGVEHAGGRESVDDALEIVESFGPGIGGLNDAYARQILLAEEVKRLRASHGQAPAGVLEDAARYRWLTADHHKQEDRIRVYEIATSMNVRGKGSIDAAIDAARKQGANHD
jgi:hypothetical protein